jgi:hypothetical protein
VVFGAVYSSSHIQFTRRLITTLRKLDYDVYLFSVRDTPNFNVTFELESEDRYDRHSHPPLSHTLNQQGVQGVFAHLARLPVQPVGVQ